MGTQMNMIGPQFINETHFFQLIHHRSFDIGQVESHSGVVEFLYQGFQSFQGAGINKIDGDADEE